jgi:hypothetical protein
MTIDDLIERLEEYRDEIGGDAEVRLMMQPNWPFEYTVAGLASRAEINEACDDDDEPEGDSAGDAAAVVYLCEGRQLGYGTKRAWEVAQ